MKISNNIGIKQFSFLSGNIKKENKYAGKQKEVMQDTFQSEINEKETNNADLKLNKIYSAIIQKLSKKSLFTKISFDEINTATIWFSHKSIQKITSSKTHLK